MSRKNKQHDKQFKLDTIQYVKEHPDLTQAECCKNLGIVFFDIATDLLQWHKRVQLSNVPMILNARPFGITLLLSFFT